MDSIDSWMWDNEKRIESLEQIKTILNMEHIVIMKLKQPKIKDMGIYVEKMDNYFLYTFWFNTENFPMLDSEKVTPDNKTFYNCVIQSILELNELAGDSLEVADVGLETDIYYEKNIIDIILKSTNMIIWLLRKHVASNIHLETFKSDIVGDMYILQRV